MLQTYEPKDLSEFRKIEKELLRTAREIDLLLGDSGHRQAA